MESPGTDIIPKLPILPSDLSEEEVREIERMVFDVPAAQRSDLLFLFGDSLGNWKPAAELYKEGMAPLVLATGLYGERSPTKERPQSHDIRDALVTEGVPASVILTEEQSTNTLENVTFGKKVLDARGIHPSSILFYAKQHHAGRCMRTLRKHFQDAIISCFAVDATYDDVMINRETWRNDPLSEGRVYGEYLRIKRYSEKGDIDA